MVVVVLVQKAASTTRGGVVLVHPPLEKVVRMTVPTILPTRRVIISSIMRRFILLVVLTVHSFPIQVNLSTELAVKVVAVVAAEVTGKVLAVADGAHTTVTVLQARRAYLHSSSEIR